MQDLAIVGLGLVGSAALRHAAARSDRVVGIGPAEPPDWPAHDGPFASHYDSGRITRRLDARTEWAVLATRAIGEYAGITARSGIDFHRAAGLAFVRDDADGIANLQRVADEVDIPIEVGPVADTLADLPYLSFPAGFTAIREPAPAGSIDPRRMIAAQLRVAELDGALVARDVVVSIRPSLSGYELLTRAGRTHQAQEVLIAAGSYGNGLVDRPLAAGVRPEAVVLGEIGPDDVERLARMPSIIHLLADPELDDVYIVPPVKYPDGRWYVKLGGSRRGDEVLGDAAAMNDWMRPGQADDRLPALQEALQSILPDVTFTSWRTRPCLITDTESQLPYIDRLDSGVCVALGGNGHAAKSADAIGALAAGLALDGAWTDDQLGRDTFRARFGAYTPPAGSRHGN